MFTGAELKDWIIILAGNIFIVILVVRAVSHFAKREWGELLGTILIAIFIGWIVYSTDTFINFLKWAAAKITGGESGPSNALGALDGAHGAVLTAAADTPQLLAQLAGGVI